ncbi:MAG: hydroxymethylpyrimidine/phosphomethylpyrimidine kinase [Bacteroidia bacterium]
MSAVRKYALSIAGYDPSGGAGLLADIKTFESNKVYGLGVITANTFQNDSEFKSVDWIPFEKIVGQIEMLKAKFSFEYVKIGLIESLAVLDKIILYLLSHAPDIKIVWDPILKASAGFEFHSSPDRKLLKSICERSYLITPNVPEAVLLGDKKDAVENAKALSQYCNVYLKGGHSEKKVGYDTLFLREGKQFSFRPKEKGVHPKHGSGCVLSSAITSNLAKDEGLHRACLKGKQYTERYLRSNKSLLGYHKI